MIFFAKKFGEGNLFIVSLQRRSKEDRARKRDVRDGREMVAMKQRIQSVTTQRKEKYDSRSNYTHRYAERTATKRRILFQDVQGQTDCAAVSEPERAC